MRKPALIAIAILLLTASILHAQTTSAALVKLTGRVMDPSGAVILDAGVKAFRGDTLTKETRTDSVGSFVLDLPPAEYRMEITAPEFKTIRQNLRVVANMPAVVVRMTLAVINTAVTVGANNTDVGIEEEKNLTSTVISGEQIKDLPEDEDALMAQLQAIAGGGGAAGGNATFVVDGFSGGRVPPRDQIQQIIVDTNVFSAEHTGGPRIQIITRPGTGPWSGNMNFGFQDEALNARVPNAPNKPSSQQRRFATSYGGPVIPGKLTMRFNASEFQTEFEGGSIVAISPDGRDINLGVFSPTTLRNFNLNGQLFVTQNNTLSFGTNYGSNKSRNQGVGGFNLQERAFNTNGRNWNLNVSDRAILSTKAIYELRFSRMQNRNSTIPVTEARAINVLDAFNIGGAQNRGETKSVRYNFGNTLRLTVNPKLNMQIGADGFYMKNHSESQQNFLGTFTFSSLADYVAQRPITYRQNSGDPSLDVNQFEIASFIQADYRFTPKLNIGAGLRYQWQTNLSDTNNFAPTFQLAFQPNPKTVIRAGGRVTFQTFGIFNTEQLLRFDGTTRQFETVILNPSYPDPFANGAGTTNATGTGSIRAKAPDLHAPYNINSAFSMEQTLPKQWRVGGSLDLVRGVSLIRTRNINAPFPGTALSDELQSRLNSPNQSVQAAARAEVDRMRPLFPIIGNINQFESTGTSFSKNIGIRIYTPPTLKLYFLGINAFANYTLGLMKDNSSAMNQYDWTSEWARASFDQRHRLMSTLNFSLPRQTSVNFFIMANSGRPYTITTGRDNNGDQSANDRPAGFARNSETGPSNYNVSMNFVKRFPLRKAEQRPAGATPGAGSFVPPQIIMTGPGGMIMMPPPPPPQGGGPAQGIPTLNFSVNVNNLLNNTQVRGISGVLTSQKQGLATGYAPGRTIILNLGLGF